MKLWHGHSPRVALAIVITQRQRVAGSVILSMTRTRTSKVGLFQHKARFWTRVLKVRVYYSGLCMSMAAHGSQVAGDTQKF